MELTLSIALGVFIYFVVTVCSEIRTLNQILTNIDDSLKKK